MRYSKNMTMLSQDENQRLKGYHVAVIGCGGLGGYVIEMLARLGIGRLSVFDGDAFDRTNLNRQVLSNENNMDKSKALAAKDRVKAINQDVLVKAYQVNFDRFSGHLVKDCDILIDCIDSVQGKLELAAICKDLEIPMVFGAIAGWYGQVASIYPGDDTLKYVYKSSKSIEKDLGNPSFTPATIASMQVAECLKILLNKEGILRHRLLFIDLLNHDYELVEFK